MTIWQSIPSKIMNAQDLDCSPFTTVGNVEVLQKNSPVGCHFAFWETDSLRHIDLPGSGWCQCNPFRPYFM